MKLKFRPGKAEDAETLSSLALRSKAFWPYDKKFIQDCAEELKISSERASDGLVMVTECNGAVVGFYGFLKNQDGPEMTHLFIEPTLIGKGIGLQLWKDALTFAKQKGWTDFKLVADPYAAEKFYLRVGCKKIGEINSLVRPGRKLPLLKYEI